MTVEKIRALTKLSQQEFCDRLHIPLVTLQDWEANDNCPEYVAGLLEYYVNHEPGFTKSAAAQIGEQLKELRQKTGLSQQKFGDWLGIPKPTLQVWEYGKKECRQYVFDLIKYVVNHLEPSEPLPSSYETSEDLVLATGLSLEDFSSVFHIPYTTIKGWIGTSRKEVPYLNALMEFKLRREGLLE